MKCWKKVGRTGKIKTVWIDVNSKMVFIIKYPPIINPKKNWTFVDNNSNRKDFERESQALEHANKYMKEHEDC